MKLSLSVKELETLSAYLDGVLSPKERARLEARLEDDAALREELESLRRTRAVLRAAPRVRAPRNFTLTPEMVSPPISFFAWLRPTMQWGAAMAMVLLLLTFVGQSIWAPTLQQSAPPELAMQAEGAPAPEVERGIPGTPPVADVQPLEMQSLQVVSGTQPMTATADISIPATPLPKTTTPPTPTIPWQALEIGLALTAAICAGLAWWLGRQK
ncbi:MAG: hypothetical protein D6755_14190 [Anaerolineae bacterium]|nr:MAG: hypothetical protein D6755_14190 [Anaerolineae bacterium]